MILHTESSLISDSIKVHTFILALICLSQDAFPLKCAPFPTVPYLLDQILQSPLSSNAPYLEKRMFNSH